MNTILGQALERAGFSPAHIRFASANYDLARLVLNREPDPARAVMRWLGMIRMPNFQDEIVAYLMAVKEEMQSSGAGEDHHASVENDQGRRVPSAPDPSSAADEDQGHGVPQEDLSSPVSPVADPTSSGDEDHRASLQKDHFPLVPPPDPEPAEDEDQPRGAPQETSTSSVPSSVTRAKLKLARLQASFYLLTDATGTHVPVEEMAVRKIPRHMNWLAERAVQHGTDFMVLRNIYQHAPQVSDDFVTVGQCMRKAEIRQWVRKGKEEAFSAAKNADATMAQIAGQQLGHD